MDVKKSRKPALENRSQQSGFVVAPGAPHKDAPADWLGFPARSLTPARIAGYFDDALRGDWTMAQWMMYNAILRDADILALVRQRKAALRGYSVNIQQVKGVDDTLAAEQAKELKARYDQFDNLGEAVDHLALAPFCHYAHVAIGDTAFEPMDQIWFVRDGLYGPWKYNPEARVTTGKDTTLKAIDESRYLIRVDAHSVFWLALAKYIRSNFSQKWWDAFAEAVSKMGTIIIAPENVPTDKVNDFVTNAERAAKGGSGSLPHGSSVIGTNATRGAIPFGEHMAWLRDSLIRAVNGSTLANVAEQGSGTLAGGAHQNTYREIIHGEARTISEVFQNKIDKPLLAEKFPGKPILAYFELGLKEAMDVQKEVANIMQLASVGYVVDPAQASQRTGYTLTRVEQMTGTPEGAAGPVMNRAKSLVPPASVRAAVRRGLELYDAGKGGDGLKPETIRRARSIAAGEAQSDDWATVEAPAWFARHTKTRPEGDADESPWQVAWLLWGGDAGRAWLANRSWRMQNREDDIIENFDPDQPRDEEGQWSESGGGGGGGGSGATKSAFEAVTLPLRKRLSFGDQVAFLAGGKPVVGAITGPDNGEGIELTLPGGKKTRVKKSDLRMPKGGHRTRENSIARDIEDLIVNRAADAVGVPESWLAPVADLLAEIEAKAADKGVSDADLLAFLESAKKRAPELFGKMDVDALAETLEKVMGGGMLDGAREALRSRKGA